MVPEFFVEKEDSLSTYKPSSETEDIRGIVTLNGVELLTRIIFETKIKICITYCIAVDDLTKTYASVPLSGLSNLAGWKTFYFCF